MTLRVERVRSHHAPPNADHHMVLTITSLALLTIAFGLSTNALAQAFVGGMVLVTTILLAGIWADESLAFVRWYIFTSCIVTLGCSALYISLPRRIRIIHPSPGLFPSKIVPHLALASSLTSVSIAIFSSLGPDLSFGTWLETTAALSSTPALSLLLYVTFFVGAGLLLFSRKVGKWRNPMIFIAAAALLAVIAILRIKLLAVPVAIAMFFPVDTNTFSWKTLSTFAVIFVVGYFGVMFTRWLGDPSELTLEKAAETFQAVLSAGFERHMVSQSSAVFNYFGETGEFQFGAVYQRLALYPFDVLFGTSLAPANPMYGYHEIWSQGPNLDRNSVHPTIYGDSFAEFGWLGIFVPGAMFFVISALGKRGASTLTACLLIPTTFTGIVMLVRGSTYYGWYYILLGCVLVTAYLIIQKGIDFAVFWTKRQRSYFAHADGIRTNSLQE